VPRRSLFGVWFGLAAVVSPASPIPAIVATVNLLVAIIGCPLSLSLDPPPEFGWLISARFRESWRWG
jgi:hypothetical protein